MSDSSMNVPASNLPRKHLPVLPIDFPTMITATTDDLPGYFESEVLESITIPHGWNIHFDVITTMRAQGVWEDVSSIISTAVRLSEAGSKFAAEWNGMNKECFRSCISVDGKVVEVKLKEMVVIARWNEEMARLRRELERELRVFVCEAFGEGFKGRVKKCFGVHRNLGVDGDGQKWWEETIELLRKQGEEWMTAGFTMEMWLEDLARLVESEGKVKEVRVFADARCASYEQGEGMRSRSELVYVVKDGVLSKKGQLAWVSVELGHVTVK